MRPPSPPRRPPAESSPSPEVPDRLSPHPDSRPRTKAPRIPPPKAQEVATVPERQIKRAQAPVHGPAEASRVFGPESTQGSEIDQRRKERRRARAGAVRRHAVRGTAMVLITGIVVWGVWFSPLFAVRDGSISVSAQSGDVDLKPVQEIVDQRIGTPLPSLNTGAVEEEILQDTKIATASVTRDWPGGLDVVVTPREPAFALEVEKGYRLVGADGVVIGGAKKLPKGTFVAELGSEDVTADDAEKLLTVWDALQKSVRSQVKVVKLSAGQISLELKEGGRVIWGRPSDGELKGEILALLMEERPSKIYDVSDPTRPSVR